ncbi:MAG TPA: HD domain-containing phosphohydrolase [Actinomycetota bacterium]|nr:HD domain-containing phosphohydrolase [Actinomycetota bacterium]
MQTSDARVLVLGEPEDAGRLEAALRSAGYEDLHVANDLTAPAELCRAVEPAVVLIDLTGPEYAGLDALRALCPSDGSSPSVAVVAAPSDAGARSASLALGAKDFIGKPLDEDEVRIRVGNLIEAASLARRVSHQEHTAQQEIRRRTSELWDSLMRLEEARKHLQTAQEETLSRLSMAAEYRDDETSGHVERMSRYCALLARANGADSETSETLRLASRLHDIGKIGVSDLILLKEGILTPTERRMMEEHVPIGVRLLEGSDSPVVQIAAIVAGSHHEKYDGTGYPRGLAGDSIPIEGRIAAIADVFDALTHSRPHRRAFPLGHVLEMMRKESGKHFDPALLDLFLDRMNTVLTIYEEHRESA